MLQSGGNGPALSGAAKTHADEVALLRGTVNKALTTVEDGQVVDEMNVAGLSLNLHLRSPSNGLNRIQSLHLTAGKGWEVLGPGMSLIAEESSTAKVHNQPVILVENDRTALEARTAGRQGGGQPQSSTNGKPVRSNNLQRKWPIRASQGTDDIRASGRKNVVNGVGRGNNTLSAGSSSAASQPADDISSLLMVESLPQVSEAPKRAKYGCLTIDLFECLWCSAANLVLLSATMWTAPECVSQKVKVARPKDMRTQHVATLVLATALLGNVR